jgi:hypothetical protein
MGEVENTYKSSAGKNVRKILFWRSRCRWWDNIKRNGKEMGSERWDRNELAQGRSPGVGSDQHGNDIWGSMKDWKFLDRLGECDLLNRDCPTRSLLRLTSCEFRARSIENKCTTGSFCHCVRPHGFIFETVLEISVVFGTGNTHIKSHSNLNSVQSNNQCLTFKMYLLTN